MPLCREDISHVVEKAIREFRINTKKLEIEEQEKLAKGGINEILITEKQMRDLNEDATNRKDTPSK